MPTTCQTLQETERYSSEQRERKEGYKTVVSGKSRNGEGRGVVCPFVTKDCIFLGP